MVALTNYSITPVAGQAAFLPNQPILHNCTVDPSAVAALVPGAVVTFASTSLTGTLVVKQAANTDIPLGVVVHNGIQSGFVAGDKISVFPVNSFVYMKAGAADLKLGDVVGFNSSNQVVTDTTSGHGRIGVVCTQPAAINDLIVIQIKPGSVAGSMSDYLTTADAATTYLAKADATTDYLTKADATTTYLTKADATTTYLTKADATTDYQAKLTAGDFIDITDNTITTTYTAGTGVEISDAGVISAT